jgi:hypothetical protein
MSFVSRITSAFFTALPSALFFAAAITSENMHTDYYGKTILITVSVLLGVSILFSLILPPGLRPNCLWMIDVGLLAQALAWFTMTLLNATPLCVGQDNGDGNNDIGECMGYVVLYALFYGLPYVLLLTISAFVGHWIMKSQFKPGGTSYGRTKS